MCWVERIESNIRKIDAVRIMRRTVFSIIFIVCILFIGGTKAEAAQTFKVTQKQQTIFAGAGDKIKLLVKNPHNKKVKYWVDEYYNGAKVSKNGKVTIKKKDARIYIKVGKKKYEVFIYVLSKKLMTKMRAVKKQIIKPGMNEVNRVKAIHDWICENCEYDITQKKKYSHSAEGVFFKGTAVCQGYSLAFYYLAKISDLDVLVISGISKLTSEEHMWNQVKINNEWYNMDVTWDDNEDKIKYRYFLVNDEINNKTHIADTSGFFGSKPRKCPRSYSNFKELYPDVMVYESRQDACKDIASKYRDKGIKTFEFAVSQESVDNEDPTNSFSFYIVLTQEYKLNISLPNVEQDKIAGHIIYRFVLVDE